jgi:hypothetical protein
MFKPLVLMLLATLAACGGAVETPTNSSDALCVSSSVAEAADQSVCNEGVTVECAAPASAAQLASFGRCEAGRAHTNTYCCAPAE